MAALPPTPLGMKAIDKYLKLAKQFEKAEPLVFYFALLHSVEIAVQKYRGVDDKFILAMMDQAEAVKKQLQAEGKDPTPQIGQPVLYAYATRWFKQADDQDRAGQATLKTAQMFKMAVLFFEILLALKTEEQDQNVVEWRKYSLVKAADIGKCIREGRKPAAGPIDANGNPIPEEQPKAEEGDGTNNNADLLGLDSQFSGLDMGNNSAAMPQAPVEPQSSGGFTQPTEPSLLNGGGGGGMANLDPYQQDSPQQQPQQPIIPATSTSSTSSYTPQPPQQQYQPQPPQQQYQPPPPQQQYTPTATAPAPHTPHVVPQQQQQQQQQSVVSSGGKGSNTPKSDVSFMDQEKATKCCKFAISALQYKDIPTAVTQLQQALELLTE